MFADDSSEFLGLFRLGGGCHGREAGGEPACSRDGGERRDARAGADRNWEPTRAYFLARAIFSLGVTRSPLFSAHVELPNPAEPADWGHHAAASV